MNKVENFLVSSLDWTRFNKFFMGLQYNGPDFWDSRRLPSSLDDMFQGDCFYAVIFEPNEKSEVGHWVLLIKLNEYDYEYFNCLGSNGIPKYLQDLIKRSNKDKVNFYFYKENFMNKKNHICGKWCMFRLQCLPYNTKQFEALCTKLKPVLDGLDELVNTIISFPVVE